MKTCKTIWIPIVVLFFASNAQAQFFFLPPATWTTTASPVISQKFFITGSLGAEAGGLALGNAFFKDLKKSESEYDKRRTANTTVNPKNALLIGTTLIAIEDTEEDIIDLQADVATIQASSVYFKHRIGGIEGDLETEKKYLDEIQDDYFWLAGGIAMGGGVGYTYTAFLKVLLRIMDVKRRVMALSKEVANLETENKIFVRK